MTGRLEQARLALAVRRRLRDRTPPAQLLAALRRHAAARSPFYRHHHARLEGAPIDQLPPVTKADVVDRFDELVTDPDARRGDLDRHLATAEPGTPFLGRYRVGVTSGSTGRPAALLFDRGEWVGLIANAAAAQTVSRSPRDPSSSRPRLAKVGSASGWHLSTQVGGTIADPRRPVLRLPATTPLPDLVSALDEWQPDGLTAYPSVLGLLAGEQIAGHLRLAPRRVQAGGEQLTPDLRRRAWEAWGVEVVDQYVLGEAGFVAVECAAHDGLHVLEEHAIVEVVDDHGTAVRGGDWGSRVLLTVLRSRTVPLVRYEVTDRARWVPGACPCGRTAPRLLLGGRARDTIRLESRTGEIEVHPSLFSSVLDAEAVGGWQVVRGTDGVRVLVTRPRDGFTSAPVAQALERALRELQVVSPVRIEVVDTIERGPGGKASLVVDGP